jgi:hypothetical protein
LLKTLRANFFQRLLARPLLRSIAPGLFRHKEAGVMNKRPLQRSTILAVSLAATTFFCVSAPAWAQTPATPNNTPSVQDSRPAPDNDARPDDARVREISDFNGFLQSHPETSEALRRDPSLIDNRDFVDHHPELRNYLQDHPQMAGQFRSNPDLFMGQVVRFDRREDRFDEAGRIPDADRDRMARFHDFCDKHPEIAEQIRHNPALMNDRDFVDHHDALRVYFQQYPDDRDQVRRDPNAFIAAEVRFDRDNAGGRNFNPGGPDRSVEGQRDFGNFLNDHKEIARDVDKRHDIVNDHDYVQNHRDLDDYLKAHPDVRNQWAANPDSFVKGAQEQWHNGTNGSGVSGNGAAKGSGSSGTATGGAGTGSTDPKQK